MLVLVLVRLLLLLQQQQAPWQRRQVHGPALRWQPRPPNPNLRYRSCAWGPARAGATRMHARCERANPLAQGAASKKAGRPNQEMGH